MGLAGSNVTHVRFGHGEGVIHGQVQQRVQDHGSFRAGKTHPLLLLYVPAQTSCVLVSDGTVHCGKLVKEYASFYQGKGGGNDVSARAIFTSDEDARLFADLLSKHLK